MKAVETQFLKLLEGKRQFIIPIYQRMYSWTLKQCEQLWKDILRVASDDGVTGHFVGSIVYIERGLYQVTAVPQLLVIDGQQRLTTLTLLLTALAQALHEDDRELEISRESIEDEYLFNKHGKAELKYKLLLTRNDKDTLVRLVESNEPLSQASTRILENYKFFQDQIAKAPCDLQAIYGGIAKLLIVDISLDRQYDNAQLIFESLNSTGLELSQADLIRNYVLMGLEPREQESLYNNYWFPMEQSFGQTDYVRQFDRFMRDYLTVRTGSIPNIRAVYEAFKAYARRNDTGTITDVVSDIYTYSKYFVRWALGKETDSELAKLLHEINTLKVDVAYPFLLELYDDYSNERLSRDDLLEILNLVQSYVFRRAICGIPTNSLNKTFAGLSREIRKGAYLESFKAALLLKDSYRRFPRDEEFMRELMAKDIYNFRSRNYLLRKFENHGRKERLEIEDYTIEHVMPQNENLSEVWQRELGENWQTIHSQYLHTLGNLTLTGYNSELSDRPFLEKRNMPGGFADSPIRLNRRLAGLDTWNENEIRLRAKELAELALTIWPFPQLDDDTLSVYVPKKDEEVSYSISDYAFLMGDMLALYNQFEKRVMNLDPSVNREFKKKYIAFKTTTNFVDVVPQKSRLRLSLNMQFDEITDPKGLCKDVSNLGRWGNGDIEVGLSHPSELDDVMALVRQSFDKHMDNGVD